MRKIIVWENREFYGTEYMVLNSTNEEIRVDSTVILIENGFPYNVNYQIRLNHNWFLKQLDIQIQDLNKDLHLKSNGQGQWFNGKGDELLELNGVFDIDLSCTPFTNSLPINRLNWDNHEPKSVDVVFISVPNLNYKIVNQRYRLVDKSKGEFHYKSGKFETIIQVDDTGLVLEYPGIFTRKY